jgi:Zn/Cd-binding protein ZinT
MEMKVHTQPLTNTQPTTATSSNSVTQKYSVRDSSGKFTKANAKAAVKPEVASNSFIKNLTIDGNTVTAVMRNNPKTVYTYKLKGNEIKTLKDAIKNKKVGEAYNTIVKPNEISRTIFK